MEVLFTENAWEDYLYWLSNDKKKIKKINELIKDISHHPSIGIGKPEPLRENLSGLWSRRISNEHRFVYSFTEKTIYIIQLRYHY
ncbi:MAG: Txe/YoeB family addiction module toxin [Desulfovibrio sp.]|nr:Txe/YoeB family addiction module toxin [Desulfovibrio sp.]